MTSTASDPRMIARGRFFSPSFTSPPANVRSAQPSNAQSTDTSASPNGASENAPGGKSGVKWPPVFGSSMENASMTTNRRPKYFAIVVAPVTSALHRMPTMLKADVRRIAPAAV